MSGGDQYFSYLLQRSWVGYVYRKHVLYPRLVRKINGKLLDIGCGIGDMLNFRAGSVGVDINKRNVDYCVSKGLNARLMLMDELPFEAASFDTVLLDNVLEHISDPGPLLKEARRVLRPNGLLLIGVPGVKGFASDPDHKVFYDEVDLVSCLKGQGFNCKEIFATPLVRSEYLSKYLRQYCIYGVFCEY